MDLYEPGATCAARPHSECSQGFCGFLFAHRHGKDSIGGCLFSTRDHIEGQLAFNEEVARAVGFDGSGPYRCNSASLLYPIWDRRIFV